MPHKKTIKELTGTKLVGSFFVGLNCELNLGEYEFIVINQQELIE
jgi:hypothetical protein